jgi:ATP-dependent DNA ligase
VGTPSRPPKWIKPQLTRLVGEAPAGGGWLHEIKYDGYRMHARIDGGQVKLLTRTGLDWSTARARAKAGEYIASSAILKVCPIPIQTGIRSKLRTSRQAKSSS